MDKTELTNDTLKQRALEAAEKFFFGLTHEMSVNDWDALQAYASYKLLEIDLEETELRNGDLRPLSAGDLKDM